MYKCTVYRVILKIELYCSLYCWTYVQYVYAWARWYYINYVNKNEIYTQYAYYNNACNYKNTNAKVYDELNTTCYAHINKPECRSRHHFS